MTKIASQRGKADETAGQRLAAALDMHDFGVALMRQNLRRNHPDASEDQIDQLLSDWLARDDEWKDSRFRPRAL